MDDHVKQSNILTPTPYLFHYAHITEKDLSRVVHMLNCLYDHSPIVPSSLVFRTCSLHLVTS